MLFLLLNLLKGSQYEDSGCFIKQVFSETCQLLYKQEGQRATRFTFKTGSTRALKQGQAGQKPGRRVPHPAPRSARPAARRGDPGRPGWPWLTARPFAPAFSLSALGDFSRPKLDTLRRWRFFYCFSSSYSIPCNTGTGGRGGTWKDKQSRHSDTEQWEPCVCISM